MNKCKLSATIYLILTVIGIILWLPIPEIIHFTGASSLVYAFLFGVAYNSFALIALLWILFLVINLIVWYIYGIKNNKFFPFFIIVGIDLMASIGCICFKVFIANYTDLLVVTVGCAIRLVYCLCLAYIGLNDNKTGDGSLS